MISQVTNSATKTTKVENTSRNFSFREAKDILTDTLPESRKAISGQASKHEEDHLIQPQSPQATEPRCL